MILDFEKQPVPFGTPDDSGIGRKRMGIDSAQVQNESKILFAYV